MMCKTAQREELAEKYIRGQLDPEVRDEFEIHLLECPKCLGRIETLNEVQMGLQGREKEIREALAAQASRVRIWLIAVAVALLLVLIGAGVWFSKSRSTGGILDSQTQVTLTS